MASALTPTPSQVLPDQVVAMRVREQPVLGEASVPLTFVVGYRPFFFFFTLVTGPRKSLRLKLATHPTPPKPSRRMRVCMFVCVCVCLRVCVFACV